MYLKGFKSEEKVLNFVIRLKEKKWMNEYYNNFMY